MRRRYKLLGTLTIKEDGQASPLMKSDKGCALMAALIIHGNPQRREYLADLFWDSVTTAQSLTRLRVLLSRVKKWTPELQTGRKQLSFQAPTDTTVDYLLLRQALATNDPAQLDEGLRLYEGDLLAGFYLEDAPRFNEWLLLEQEQLRQQVVSAYRQICSEYARQEAWLKGVDAARRWLLLDEFDEEALRHLLQFLAASGQVNGALQQYEHNRTRLWEELGVEPETETAELAHRLTALRAETGGGITWDAIVGAQLAWPEPSQLAEPGPLPVNAFLPYQRNSDFIGRRDSLLQLAEFLLPHPKGENKSERAAAITGMGGRGKTQLAVEFAYRYGRYFPGGVYWMNFAQAEDVAEEVSMTGGERGMGLYKQADKLTLTDQIGRVQKAWQEPVPRLLIFDNCEEEALLAKWLPKTGGCRVLLTSRRGRWSRDLGVAQWPLPVLDLPESAAFLRRLLPDLDQEQAEQIAHEVGRLPLALHLAGGFLRRYPQISPAQYLSQLSDKGLLQHPSLQGRGLSHSPTGHELNVARTFALSMEQFKADDEVDCLARQLLACAASFAPGEPVPQDLLRSCVIDDEQDLIAVLVAEDGLARLVTLGFLEAEGRESVVLHHLLAAYAQEEMAADSCINSAQTAVKSEIARILTDIREEKGTLACLPFSVVHLSHITDRALANQTPLAATLAILLGFHLLNIANNDEAERVLKQAYSAAGAAGNIPNQVDALNLLSRSQERLGHDEDSLDSAQKAIQLLKQDDLTDPAGLAEVIYRQGWAHFRLGQAQDALDAAHEGYSLGQAAGIPSEMGRNLNLLAVVNYYMLGNHDIAASQLEEGLAIYGELGNRNSQASILNNMGENARLQGDYPQAVTYYERSLEIARELNNRNLENIVLSNLCGTRLRLGHFQAAATDLEKLLARTKIDWFGSSEANRFLAEAYLGLGKTMPALEKAQQALALAHPANAAENGRAWRVLGYIAAQSDQPVQVRLDEETQYDAPTCFHQSITLFTEQNLERDRAISLWRLAQFELVQGDETQGQEHWQQARTLFNQLHLPLFIAKVDDQISRGEAIGHGLQRKP